MAAKILNASSFEQEVLKNNGTVLVDFYADWCGPCKMLAPVIDEIAQQRTDVTVGKVNVDSCPGIAANYGIMSIPTLIVFKEGKEYIRAVGGRSKKEILSMIG